MALSPAEARLWTVWKHATETVISRVGSDIQAATGLSGSDFAVLSRLVDLGDGELRQQRLADSMGWDKSRLSHHLTRMTKRELVERKPGRGVTIAITEAGARAIARARPIHAKAVRARLIRLVPRSQRARFSALLELLAAG
jgi:DNA-binding MarR family transcriptional regulator